MHEPVHRIEVLLGQSVKNCLRWQFEGQMIAPKEKRLDLTCTAMTAWDRRRHRVTRQVDDVSVEELTAVTMSVPRGVAEVSGKDDCLHFCLGPGCYSLGGWRAQSVLLSRDLSVIVDASQC